MTDESKNIRLASEGLRRGSIEFVVYLCTYMHVCLSVCPEKEQESFQFHYYQNAAFFPQPISKPLSCSAQYSDRIL